MAGDTFGREPRSIEKEDKNDEIERLLVEGELVDDGNGGEIRTFPRSCDIADRLGVSAAWVSKFARKHRCFERRAAMLNAIKEKARAKLMRIEANRIAFQTADQLALCDTILAKYKQAFEAREVGNVTAADINAIIRLRHFVQGDADQRSEVSTHSVTLEMMQEAHTQLSRTLDEASDEERGVVQSLSEARTRSSGTAAPESEVNLKINHSSTDAEAM